MDGLPLLILVILGGWRLLAARPPPHIAVSLCLQAAPSKASVSVSPEALKALMEVEAQRSENMGRTTPATKQKINDSIVRLVCWQVALPANCSQLLSWLGSIHG